MEFQTGDLILFRTSITPSIWWGLDALISMFTMSPWVHVGIVIRDPEWLGLKGLYLWESVGFTGLEDAVDKDHKFGVQVVPLHERLQGMHGVHYRQYQGEFPSEHLEGAYHNTHNKPYDLNLIDWLEAAVRFDLYPQRTRSFWCSALVTYILTKSGVLPPMTDWSITPPSYLAWDELPGYGTIKKYHHKPPEDAECVD